MAAHIWDAGQLQQALEGAVLSVFPVQHRKYHVNPLAHHAVPSKVSRPWPRTGEMARTPVAWMLLPLAGGQQAVIPAAIINPIAGLGNPHRENVKFVGIHVLQHGFCRTQRNLMLR